MTLFQGVLRELGRSKGPLTFQGIATAIGKSPMSVHGEIGRLKKTSWFGNWLRVDWKKQEVTLTKPLRGCSMEALEFLVKQFYAKDKATGKGMFDKSKRIDLNEGEQIQADLNGQLLMTTELPKKVEEDKFDFSTIELDNKPENTLSFDDINFEDFGCNAGGR